MRKTIYALLLFFLILCRQSYPLQFSGDQPGSTCLSSYDSICKDANLSYPAKLESNVPNKEILKLWTLFPSDIFANVGNISLGCQKEYNSFLQRANRNQLDALKLFDANAKLPSGILSGNINQYGDFDECLEVPNAHYCLALIDLQPALANSRLHKYKHLIHSYFAITETFKDPLHRVPGSSFVRWGFCIPKQCSPLDLKNVLRSKLGVAAKIAPNMCQSVKKPLKLSYGDYIARGYFIIILTLVVASSLLHEKPGQNSHFLKAFSLQRNFKKLTNLSENRTDIRSVHGVRFFSALALLMAHKTMALLYNPYINKVWMAESQAMKWSVVGRNSVIYTDSFLLISGLLNANALFADLEKQKSFRFREKLISRLVRFIPGMLTIILFCTYILPHLGSGPLWPIVIDHHAILCKKYMWRNFLFIHNYFGFDKMCLTHMHQLGIDMQLFLATPFFVYIIWKNTKLGWIVIGGVSAVSTIMRFYNTLHYKLSHVVHFGVPISRMFDTANFSYILPSHRASIYLMGIVLAWALRKHKTSKKHVMYWWILSYTIGFATWFAPIKMSLKDYVYDAREAALYGAIYPFSWGIAISWVIYSTESHFGGWMGTMLTWKYFRIFTKIAYGVYLIQFPVFFYNVGVTRHSGEYRSILMLPSLETVLIVILATCMSLTVEMPFQNLYRTWTNDWKIRSS